jgi:hypothetical protein
VVDDAHVSVPCHPGLVVDESLAMAEETVEEGGLAHVRSAHDHDARKSGQRLLPVPW